MEVVPLSQLLFVCFACVLVSLCALSFTLSLSCLALLICVCVGVGVVVDCSLSLSFCSLSRFQTLNLLRTVAQIAQTRNLEMALVICDCNCDCKVNFCVHLRLQHALPKKAASSHSRQHMLPAAACNKWTLKICDSNYRWQQTEHSASWQPDESRAYSIYYIHIHMSPASICARLSFSIPSTSPSPLPSLLCCSCCQSVGRFGLLRFQKFPCVISEMQIWT